MAPAQSRLLREVCFPLSEDFAEDVLFWLAPVFFFDVPPRTYLMLILAVSVELMDTCFNFRAIFSLPLISFGNVMLSIRLVSHLAGCPADGIVDKELFEKVQDVQRRFSLPTKKAREYPLKGKVYCGCCDHALSRIAQKRPFYMCRHSTADLNSRCRDVRADAAGLEEAVLLTLKKQLEVLLPVHEDGTIHLEATAAKCSEYEKQLEALKDQKQALFERYLLGQIELDTYKSEKAVYDTEILKVKNAYAAVTAQAKLKREEQARQSSRQEIAHSIAEADVLTSELTDLLIEKVYVFPDNRIEIVYKIHDLFE